MFPSFAWCTYTYSLAAEYIIHENIYILIRRIRLQADHQAHALQLHQHFSSAQINHQTAREQQKNTYHQTQVLAL